MYAIVKVGGKQYKVEPNTYFKAEKIEANVGDKVELPCLLVADGENVEIATAESCAKAVCEVLEFGKEKKVVVYKYKPKKNIRKKQITLSQHNRRRVAFFFFSKLCNKIKPE